MGQYNRTLAELSSHAVLHWPGELLAQQADASILPLLLETQDKFISLLNLADSGPESWQNLLAHVEEINNPLFLKHLMVLSDLGGEALNKLTPFSRYFQRNTMHYVWREQEYAYTFHTQIKASLHNKSLRVDGRSLLQQYPLDTKMSDVVMLLLHGGTAFGDTLPEEIKTKCVIGSLLGEPEQVKTFVKQNYIRVSRQLSGASSNSLGNLAQEFVRNALLRELPSWQIGSGHIPGISHDDGNTETTFDLVVKSPGNIYFAIESSFQVTTNSVIERKAGQAKARADILHKAGHYMCYVIDGAGNINVRKRAVSLICQYSDCTVAFAPEEMQVLAQFLRVTEEQRQKEL